MLIKSAILCSVSLAAMGFAAPALAQDTDEDTSGDGDTIVVTGIRSSLESAQSIKENATAVVDSIVAEDIGKLPDNTVSDAPRAS